MTDNEKHLNALLSGDTVRHVEYDDGKTRDITVTEPDEFTRMQAIDMADAGDNKMDLASAFELCMEKVITKPRMSYEFLDKELPDNLRDGHFQATNKAGKKITVHMHIGSYRTAVSILTNSQKANGGSNLTGTLEDLANNILCDSKKSVVGTKFFEKGALGDGLGIIAIRKGLEFLSNALSYKGNLAVLTESFRFLTTSVKLK